jgi:hypothetical protein|nr:MAG TPA: hypothetical protein [Caudoviricetes sp.]DAN79108.1 MAG TPA: hypothetical protein [Caudoviricetes sp.]
MNIKEKFSEFGRLQIRHHQASLKIPVVHDDTTAYIDFIVCTAEKEKENIGDIAMYYSSEYHLIPSQLCDIARDDIFNLLLSREYSEQTARALSELGVAFKAWAHGEEGNYETILNEVEELL